MEGTVGLIGSLLSIIMINIVLSGDNAVVIAMATMRLPGRQKKMGIIWGTAGAILLRILLTVIAASILDIPYIRTVGGVLLAWIAVRLLKDNQDEKEHKASEELFEAIKTIIIADLLMSLDNVLAVAGASRGHFDLLIIGLVFSIPLVIGGSTVISGLMVKWPWLILIGAGLLGWTAGEMILGEPYLAFARAWEAVNYGLPALSALAVIFAGKLGVKKMEQGSGTEVSAGKQTGVEKNAP